MTWKQFYSKYPYTVNKYPNTEYLNTTSKVIIKMLKTEQTKKNYSKWHTISVFNEVVPVEIYLNSIEGIPYRKSIGCKDRVDTVYIPQCYGKLPWKITTIHEDKVSRTILQFTFE